MAGTIAAVLVLKNSGTDADAEQDATAQKGLPYLVDLGTGKCASCKMMTPVPAELRRDFSGVFSVTFIDVGEERDAVEKYAIRMIPTQIFYDAAGEELFRHEGFFSRDDILATWRKHGVSIPAQPALTQPPEPR